MSHSLRPHGLCSPWHSPGQNTGVGGFSLLQGIFPAQGWNPGLPHRRRILYWLSHKESPLCVCVRVCVCVCVCVCVKVNVKSLSRVRLFATPWTVAYQAPPSMGFSRQEYWSGLPFPSSGDLPDPGIEPGSCTLGANALTSEPPGKTANAGVYIYTYIH